MKSLLALLILLTLPSSALAQTDSDPVCEAAVPAETADAYYQQARACYDLQDFEQAIAHFTRAIELDSSHADAYMWRGYTYRSIGEYQLALDDLTRAIELDRQNAWAYATRGWVLDQLGDSSRAMSDYSRALQLDPQMVDVYIYRANAYRAEGKHDLALADYTAAAAVNPDYPDAQWGLGIANYDLERYEDALIHYHRYLELIGDDAEADAYWGLANVYYHLERYEDALTYYRRYLELAGEAADPDKVAWTRDLEQQQPSSSQSLVANPALVASIAVLGFITLSTLTVIAARRRARSKLLAAAHLDPLHSDAESPIQPL